MTRPSAADSSVRDVYPQQSKQLKKKASSSFVDAEKDSPTVSKMKTCPLPMLVPLPYSTNLFHTLFP